MKLNELNKLKHGTYYKVTVIEDNTKPFEDGVKNTYIVEYRGKDIEVDYYLFWIEDNTCATPFHCDDIIECKEIIINDTIEEFTIEEIEEQIVDCDNAIIKYKDKLNNTELNNFRMEKIRLRLVLKLISNNIEVNQ